MPGVRRYVQSHIVGTRTRPDIPETDVEIDGIAELWYDDEAALARAAATPEMKRLTDDGALFIGRIKSYVDRGEADHSVIAVIARRQAANALPARVGWIAFVTPLLAASATRAG